MHTLQAARNSSRFTALLQLARSVADAPVGTDGIPCVLVGVEKHADGTTVYARTGNPELDTQLVMHEKDEGVIRSSVDYVIGRLKAIGFRLAKSEAELPIRIA